MGVKSVIIIHRDTKPKRSRNKPVEWEPRSGVGVYIYRGEVTQTSTRAHR